MVTQLGNHAESGAEFGEHLAMGARYCNLLKVGFLKMFLNSG